MTEQYRKTPRASFIDYDGGDFFITICTKDMRHSFGEIRDGEMQLNEVGQYTDEQLRRASTIYPGISVPLHVVMPNHLHAIICIEKDISQVCHGDMRSPDPLHRDVFTQRRHMPALSRYVNSLKGTVTKYARASGKDFHWQGRYHDHLIRDTRDGNNIAEYILNNVARWDEDCFNKP